MELSENSNQLDAASRKQPSEGDGTVLLNLAKFGPGDPSPITAATLGRSTFPRLLRTMEDQPAAQSADGHPGGHALPSPGLRPVL